MNKKAMDAMKQVKSAMAALEASMNMNMADGEPEEDIDMPANNETKGMEEQTTDKKKMFMAMMKQKLPMLKK
jgi:hypothetical protein